MGLWACGPVGLWACGPVGAARRALLSLGALLCLSCPGPLPSATAESGPVRSLGVEWTLKWRGRNRPAPRLPLTRDKIAEQLPPTWLGRAHHTPRPAPWPVDSAVLVTGRVEPPCPPLSGQRSMSRRGGQPRADLHVPGPAALCRPLAPPELCRRARPRAGCLPPTRQAPWPRGPRCDSHFMTVKIAPL